MPQPKKVNTDKLKVSTAIQEGEREEDDEGAFKSLKNSPTSTQKSKLGSLGAPSVNIGNTSQSQNNNTQTLSRRGTKSEAQLSVGGA